MNVDEEYEAFEKTQCVFQSSTSVAKNTVKTILGEKGVQTVKGLLGKK